MAGRHGHRSISNNVGFVKGFWGVLLQALLISAPSRTICKSRHFSPLPSRPVCNLFRYGTQSAPTISPIRTSTMITSSHSLMAVSEALTHTRVLLFHPITFHDQPLCPTHLQT